ncbi:hypothetical protein [Vagococcus xieshaowenii]|uniref:Gram-positive cocci surface proteins LPxTG domain-containing protein n=1 Tax=Vagococcus xieshaowenii TaxID=2562451 RepID=A0AAJ5JLK8_9ENTE|nr:hypothetical protein [Vagococcus xieshaowenii]QCA28170.1 hypothetical protein E4Z98_02145 [Vagococcus xieshaowenii]TFZ42523.1 hypothetical protein E4031_03075 [Vagococcus xieshaowenii]
MKLKMSLVLVGVSLLFNIFSPMVSATESKSSIKFYIENKAPIEEEQTTIVPEENLLDEETSSNDVIKDNEIAEHSITNNRNPVVESSNDVKDTLTSKGIKESTGRLPQTGFRQPKLAIVMGILFIIIAVIIKKKEGRKNEKN